MASHEENTLLKGAFGEVQTESEQGLITAKKRIRVLYQIMNQVGAVDTHFMQKISALERRIQSTQIKELNEKNQALAQALKKSEKEEQKMKDSFENNGGYTQTDIFGNQPQPSSSGSGSSASGSESKKFSIQDERRRLEKLEQERKLEYSE